MSDQNPGCDHDWPKERGQCPACVLEGELNRTRDELQDVRRELQLSEAAHMSQMRQLESELADCQRGAAAMRKKLGDARSWLLNEFASDGASA